MKLYVYIQFDLDTDDQTDSSSSLIKVAGPYKSLKETKEYINADAERGANQMNLDTLDYEHIIGNAGSAIGILDDSGDSLKTIYAIYDLERN